MEAIAAPGARLSMSKSLFQHRELENSRKGDSGKLISRMKAFFVAVLWVYFCLEFDYINF